MEERSNREYISENTLNSGSEFLMHYGVKGMKWNKHKKISNPVYETRDAAVKTAINSGLKGATKTAINKTRSDSTKKISSATLKGLGDRHPSRSAQFVGRNAVLRGLSKNPKAKANYLKAERTRINHRQAKASLQLAKGYAKINKFFKIKPNAKNKKAANKNWRKNRDIFYESL